MPKETILGESPSGSHPAPDSVIPGEGTIPDRYSGDDESGDSITAESLDRDVPGDPTTAFHRSRVYRLLALGFERPGETFRQALAADAYRSDLVESARGIDDNLAASANAVGEYIADADPFADGENIDEGPLYEEWASLFGVEEGITVSPYELTYLPGPLMTNVRKLADLSGFYEAFDLEVVSAGNDRRDHLCFQLEFLGHLSLREATLRSEDDGQGVAIVVDAYRQFVESHLGRWYWRFADDVSQHGDGFYAALATLLAALVEGEIDRLDVDPLWVPDDPAVTEWTEDVFGDSGRGCGGCGADPQGIAGPNATGSGPDADGPELDRNFDR